MMATADNTNGSGDPRMPPSTLMRKVPQSMSSSLASLDGASADNNRSRESVVIDEELFTNSTTSTRVAEDHVCYNIGDDTPQDSDKTHEEDRYDDTFFPMRSIFRSVLSNIGPTFSLVLDQ